MVSNAPRTAAREGVSNADSGYSGENPALSSRVLRSRNGTSSPSARFSTIARLGFARPVSRKHRWRIDTAASVASASWLSRRAPRQCFSRGPTSGAAGG